MGKAILLVYWAFVIFALRQDIKESPRVSHAIWIPAVWLALGASKSIVFWLYPGLMNTAPSEHDFLAGSPLERNSFILLMAMALIVLYRRRGSFSFNFRSNRWIYVFYGYALISASWSDYFGVSLKRWIKVAGDIIMVLAILTETDPDEAIDRIFRRCSIILIPLSVVYVRWFRWIGVYYDRTGQAYMWRGVSDNKNGLGLLCAFFGMYLIWRFVKGWPRSRSNYVDGFLLLLTLYLLYGSRSATSMVVLIMGSMILALGILFKGNKKRLNHAIVTAMVLVLFLQGFFTIVLNRSIVSLVFSSTGRDSSFTGRTPLWSEMLRIGGQRPIFGYGYGGFWGGDVAHSLWQTFEWRPINSHNGYIDVFVDLGLLGIVFLFVLIFTSFKKNMQALQASIGTSILYLAFLVMIVFHNLTESSLARGTDILWLLFLLASAVVIRKPEGGSSLDSAL